ncbi:MAG: hypothetical protein WD874_00480 [Parcubacteria group bacterium]
MKTKAKPKHSNIGKWVEKKTRSEILLCPCGAKYIKTRKGQGTCVKCLVLALQ